MTDISGKYPYRYTVDGMLLSASTSPLAPFHVAARALSNLDHTSIVDPDKFTQGFELGAKYAAREDDWLGALSAHKAEIEAEFPGSISERGPFVTGIVAGALGATILQEEWLK